MGINSIYSLSGGFWYASFEAKVCGGADELEPRYFKGNMRVRMFTGSNHVEILGNFAVGLNLPCGVSVAPKPTRKSELQMISLSLKMFQGSYFSTVQGRTTTWCQEIWVS